MKQKKITRIHAERRVPHSVTLRPGQEVRDQMDHRAWAVIAFDCPYCGQKVSAPASMQQASGHIGTSRYTVVAEHDCKS